jgi:hypothetical protein
VENQKQVSHFPTAARDDHYGSLFQPQKPKKGSRPRCGLLIFTFQDHLVLETAPAFRIILGLENARPISDVEPEAAT